MLLSTPKAKETNVHLSLVKKTQLLTNWCHSLLTPFKSNLPMKNWIQSQSQLMNSSTAVKTRQSFAFPLQLIQQGHLNKSWKRSGKNMLKRWQRTNQRKRNQQQAKTCTIYYWNVASKNSQSTPDKQASSLKSLRECKFHNYFQKVRLIKLCCYVSVKADHIKMSLDYLASNDQEMASNVIGAIDMVRDVFFYSDKCAAREL